MDQKMNSDSIHNQTPDAKQVHLIDYLNIIQRRKWIVIIFFLSVVCVVAFKTRATKPVYKADTRVFIERQSSFMRRMAEVDMDPRKSYSETQYELLKSRAIASKVIEGLELREYVASIKAEKPDYLTLTLKRVTKFLKSLVPRPGHEKTEGLGTLFREKNEDVPKDRDKVVDWYLSKLEVLPVPETSLVDIGFLSQSPVIAARVANVHAETFIEDNNQLQRMASRQALDWIKTQLRDHKINVGESQRKVNEYKYEKLNSLSLDDESIFSLPEFAHNRIITDLHKKLTVLKVQKTEMTSKFGPKYPKIIEINSSIKQLEQEFIREVHRLRLTIKEELDRSSSLIKEPVQQTQHAQLQQHEAGTISSGAVNNYDILQLEADSDQEIYDILLKQAKELSLTGNLERNNIRIVDKAEIPRHPVKPNILLNFLLSVVLGLAFGTGFAFFFEYMDNTVRTREDVTQSLGMPVIGALPYDKLLKREKALALPSTNDVNNKQKKRIGNNANPQYGISGRLVSSLPLMQSKTTGQAFLVESATSGEGKTTVLVKSAISLARGGLRVLMVDADMQHPSLHNIFGLQNDGRSGLANVMTRLSSRRIGVGSLNKYSVDDLFFLIALKKRSGRLFIKNDTQSMTAVFENGRLFHLQSKDVHFSNRLGSTLQRGGFITKNQLKDALERNQRTGQPLGYILINAGYINQDQLRGPLKLQMEENLQKLFSWKQGIFSFESGSVETYEDKRIYFQEDYTPIINRLGRMTGSRWLEMDLLSCVKPVNEPNLSLISAGTGYTKHDSWYFWKGVFFYKSAGTKDAKPEGSLYCTLLGKFLELLKQRYDVILVDAPPVLDTMFNSSPLFSIVDGVIFVVKSGHVSVKHIKEATGHLKEAKANIIGAILNQAKAGKEYNSYYYT